MVNEEIAADKIERIVSEGKMKHIAGDRTSGGIEVSARAVEKGNVQFALVRQCLANPLRDVSGTGGDFEKRDALTSVAGSSAADQVEGGADSAEELIEHLQVSNGFGDLARRATVGVEEFVAGAPFHSNDAFAAHTEVAQDDRIRLRFNAWSSVLIILDVRHRSRATFSRQPRQVRKEATVTGSFVCSGPPVPGFLAAGRV
jgi:hypothetical protein